LFSKVKFLKSNIHYSSFNHSTMCSFNCNRVWQISNRTVWQFYI